jgi:hypothetical protein
MTTKSKKGAPAYKYVRAWVKQYGSSGRIDMNAVHDFMDVEPRYEMRGLQSDLLAITRGNFEEKMLDVVVGKKRKVKHGTYEDWAKIMLLWIASHKT